MDAEPTPSERTRFTASGFLRGPFAASHGCLAAGFIAALALAAALFLGASLLGAVMGR